VPELNHENLDDFDCRPVNKEPLSESGKSFVEAARQKWAEKEPEKDEPKS